VKQRVQLDWDAYPISLVVAVETGSNAVAVLDKLWRFGQHSRVLASISLPSGPAMIEEKVDAWYSRKETPRASTSSHNKTGADG
jgi:hypothetical protein